MGRSEKKQSIKSSARRKRKMCSQKKKEPTVRRTKYAVIPEIQDRSYADKEYTTCPEEKVWHPQEDVEEWIPSYIMQARFLLTIKQQYEGTSNKDAMEISCSGDAEQYIMDVLHESGYKPQDALWMIFTKDIPQKIADKWTPEEMKLFTEGIMKYGKRFSIIRREMLPHKRVVDFANFYYVWKRSSMAEAWRKSRAEIKAEKKRMEEERLKKKSLKNLSKKKPPCKPQNNKLPCDQSKKRIMTRSATAAARLSCQSSEGTDDDNKTSTLTSPSENDRETSSAADSTDSSKEYVQKIENGLLETATTEKSPMKNEQISDNSMKCTKQRLKRKSSIPRRIVIIEQKFADEVGEIKYVPPPIIPQWKRHRKIVKHVG